MPTMQPAFRPEPSPCERRRSRRVRLLTQVESKTACDVTSLGHSEDISKGGMLVATSETIEPKTEVIVRFHLPAPPRVTFIETLGEVVRVRPAKFMGIRFLDLKFCDRKAIDEFVKRGRGVSG